MAQFNIGSKVIQVNTDTHGVVIDVMPARRGRQLYKVSFLSGVSDALEADLRADFDESDPFERCKGGIFGSYSEYSKMNTTFKIKNSNNSTISSLKASKTLFRAYQFKPLLKFLNSPNRRLLVADEVGLGKTIEAGHIMLELKARNELKNVLIICPMSLQDKWQGELHEKFGLNFKIYNTAKELISDLSERISVVRGIINYEKVRMRKAKEPKNEKNVKTAQQTEKKQQSTNLIDFLTANPRQFSLVLCDEAHKIRNRDRLTYKGADIIISNANAAVFLTATPIMMSEEDLYNLLHLLDNTRYFNYEIFRNRLQENKPFVEALTNLNHNVDLVDIYKKLVSSIVKTRFSSNDKEIYSKDATIEDLFSKDPMFIEILNLLCGEDTPQVRARLQYLLSSMSVMNTVFSRTRKREVTTDMSQAERQPHLCKVELYKEEQEEFDNVIEQYTEDNSYEDYWGEEKLTFGGTLGLVQKKRQVASSVWGYLNNESKLDKGIDEYAKYPDAKVKMLLKIIDEVFKNGTKKLVVFALFRKTLKYLHIRLKQKGINALIIHGQIENRSDILTQFKKDENVHILLSSEVGSEGLDMQFCNSMVNYDLPWNPMVVEQRIGRIDRFGQKAKVVNVYNMVVAGSIQEEIYMRLLERIGIFRGTIGDMEAILDAPLGNDNSMSIQSVYAKMEKDFFTKELSKEDRERKIKEVELAIENEKENLHHLQEGLSNTLTNDAYFRDEINRILYNNAYVTEIELKNYVDSVIQQKLTTCNLVPLNQNVYEFQVSISQPSALRNFLTKYTESDDESQINLAQFRRKIDESPTFKLTFNQEVAYDDNTIHYLNIYHPMIQACLRYFIEHDDEKKTSFSYALESDDLLKKGSIYFMGLYQLITNRMVQGIKKRTAELLPVFFDVAKNEVIKDIQVCDRLFRRSQVEGAERNITNADASTSSIDEMRYDFADFIASEKKSRLKQANLEIESDRIRNEQQTIEYYKSRIDSYHANIREWEGYLEFNLDKKEEQRWTGAIRLARANMNNLEKDRADHLARINADAELSIEDKILSINLITII